MKILPFILILTLIIFSCKKEDPKPDPIPTPIAIQKLSKVSYSSLHESDSMQFIYPLQEMFRFNYNDTGKLVSLDINQMFSTNVKVFQRMNIYYKLDTLIDYVEFEEVDTVFDYKYWDGQDTIIKENQQLIKVAHTKKAFYDGNHNFQCFSNNPPTDTYIFDQSGRLEEIRIGTALTTFTYDNNDNVIDVSKFNEGELNRNYKMTYDNHINPFYRFYPYVIWDLPFRPVYNFRPIMMSPNNMISYKKNVYEVIRELTYEYDLNGYPTSWFYSFDQDYGHFEYNCSFEYETFYVNQ